MVFQYSSGSGFSLRPKRTSAYPMNYIARDKTLENPRKGVVFSRETPIDTLASEDFSIDNKSFDKSERKVSSFDHEPIEEGKKEKCERRLLHCFSILFGVLWLVPACFLVYVNFSSWVIGAAAWCPRGYCPVISYYPLPAGAELASLAYDHDNHNLLGTLQFASKAMEVWFMFIATNLVYTLTCMLARKDGGLPIGYMLTHLEFMDLRALFDPVLWMAPGGQRRSRQDGRTHTTHLYVFAALVAILCILSNLMGPSVAVLMIPTQQWVDTPQIPGPTFDQLLSSSPPSGDGTIAGCNGTQLSLGSYECSAWAYQSSLDAMADYFTSVIRQSDLIQANLSIINPAPPSTMEDSITFAFNVTYASSDDKLETYWAPNRQVMRALSNDFNQLASTLIGVPLDDTYVPYNNSLSLVLQRQGPIVGVQLYPSYANLTTTIVDSQREIRCYDDLTAAISNSIPATKCFRKGVGWNITNSEAEFSVDKGGSTGLEILTTVYWADKTTYATADVSSCFPNGTLPANVVCDWDDIFNRVDSFGTSEGRTEDVFVLEYRLPSSPQPEVVFVAEVYPSLGFATYSVDATTIYPSVSNAIIPNPPNIEQTQPFVLNAAWVLAAWSVRASGDVGTYRASASELQIALVSLHEGVINGTDFEALYKTDDWIQWYYSTIFTSVQATSLVNYNMSSTGASASAAAASQANANQTVLWTNLRRQVWMYGLDSRTSKLGIIVMLIGIATVFARTVLVAWTRLGQRSAVELMVTALEHPPRREFEHTKKELEMAQVRFKMHDHPDGEKVALLPIL